MSEMSIVLGSYPHTANIKASTTFAGREASFPGISPVHDAFDDMVRTQRYDVCEMAIGAFLQAYEANKPLLLLPVVMVGGFHQGSIFASPVEPLASPRDLAGRRVGVRSYSQTTGLWVRAILAEDYGVKAEEVTWVTTEGSHADEYHDPANVVRTEKSLKAELRDGGISAAILGSAADADMTPLLGDPVGEAWKWYEAHGTVPINHMVVVTRDLIDGSPDVVEAVYSALAIGIDQATSSGQALGANGLPSAIRHGRDAVRAAVEMAAVAAFDQKLISRRVTDVDDLFAL